MDADVLRAILRAGGALAPRRSGASSGKQGVQVESTVISFSQSNFDEIGVVLSSQGQLAQVLAPPNPDDDGQRISERRCALPLPALDRRALHTGGFTAL